MAGKALPAPPGAAGRSPKGSRHLPSREALWKLHAPHSDPPASVCDARAEGAVRRWVDSTLKIVPHTGLVLNFLLGCRTLTSSPVTFCQ